jgi:hypothetical protein
MCGYVAGTGPPALWLPVPTQDAGDVAVGGDGYADRRSGYCPIQTPT